MGPGVIWRVGCTVVAIVAVETIVCGLAAAPIVWSWSWLAENFGRGAATRRIVLGFAVVPSYIVFALCLIGWSALATKITGARTRSNVEMRIADFDWPLMTWARYRAATHIVRVVAGPLFRASPVWTAYLRLNGARIGRRVHVNTTFISDHNLLDMGDDVVIGGEVHMSGHTVEAGVVKTGGVRLGNQVTIGLGSVIDIDVEIGDRCQVGALSLVPKHSRLDGAAIYAGIPAKRLTDRARPAH
jgi:acetyltransferase-like isoleucine patch superfamily enzyme